MKICNKRPTNRRITKYLACIKTFNKKSHKEHEKILFKTILMIIAVNSKDKHENVECKSLLWNQTRFKYSYFLGSYFTYRFYKCYSPRFPTYSLMRKKTDKSVSWPFYDTLWLFFGQLHYHLSQN